MQSKKLSTISLALAALLIASLACSFGAETPEAPQASPAAATNVVEDNDTSPTEEPEAKPTEKPKDKPAETAKKTGPQRLDSQQLASLLDKKLPKAERKPLNTSALATSLEKAIPRGALLDARATATLVAHHVETALSRWEPRIEVTRVDSWPDATGTIKVQVHYRIKSTLQDQELALMLSGS